MKTKIWLSIILILWIFAWVPRRARIQIEGASSEHVFLKLSHFQLNVPGLVVKNLDKALARDFVTPHFLKEQGYNLKFSLGQGYTWFFGAKSNQDNKDQLILREEVVDEFEGQKSSEIYLDEAKSIVRYLKNLEKSKDLRTAILIVPSKIFANSISVKISDGQRSDIAKLGVAEDAQTVGSENQQLQFEQNLRAQGESTINLIDFYREVQRQKKIFPLYPYGETHWSRELMYNLGPEIIKQSIQNFGLSKDCFNLSHENIYEKPKDLYYGDLFVVLGVDESSRWGDIFKTQMLGYDPALYEKPKFLAECPVIYYIGTSYGTFLDGHGGIVDSMQRAYRNSVINKSVSGFGALEPVRRFTNLPAEQKSIVIVEMPFRQIKDQAFSDDQK